MRTIPSLSDLAALVAGDDRGADLYLRWSRGPLDDSRPQAGARSRDALTGVPLPGLSASPLRVEQWWGDRSRRLWVARRLYDYRHLERLRGPGVRPWVLRGAEAGRGPDNEPLVARWRPLAWVSADALRECEELMDDQDAPEWGSLQRQTVGKGQ